MALSAYTFNQKEHFLRFLVEHNTVAENSVWYMIEKNPDRPISEFHPDTFSQSDKIFRTLFYEQGEAIRQFEINKSQLENVLTKPDKPLDKCLISCVVPILDPVTRKYAQDLNLEVPDVSKLNAELRELGLSNLEVVNLSYLRDIYDAIKPVYETVRATVQFVVNWSLD